jgi:hypothetical protein
MAVLTKKLFSIYQFKWIDLDSLQAEKDPDWRKLFWAQLVDQRLKRVLPHLGQEKDQLADPDFFLMDHGQVDQMSFKKLSKNVALPNFLANYVHNLLRGK